jgi:hypothetical protein
METEAKRSYIDALIRLGLGREESDKGLVLIDVIMLLWEISPSLLPILTDGDVFPVVEGSQRVASLDSVEVPQTDPILNQIFNNIVGSSKSDESTNDIFSTSTPLPLCARMGALVEIVALFDQRGRDQNFLEVKTLMQRSPSLFEEIIERDIWGQEQIIII